MKSLVGRFTALLLTALLLAGVSLAKENTAQFKVTGMYCAACQMSIEKALKKTAGVKTVSVDWKQGSATVVYDDATTNPQQLAKVIQRKGFKAELQKP